MAPPSSPAHLQCSSAPQQGSPAPLASLPSSRLQQGLCGFLSSAPSLPPSSSPSPDSCPSRCPEDDLGKPKGKRPCKTKHTEGEAGQEEAEVGGAEDQENGMVSQQMDVVIEARASAFSSTSDRGNPVSVWLPSNTSKTKPLSGNQPPISRESFLCCDGARLAAATLSARVAATTSRVTFCSGTNVQSLEPSRGAK